jgi:hypothetical protein
MGANHESMKVRPVDPTPEKIDGTRSYVFEQDDLERAEETSDAVKEYCADAVSRPSGMVASRM